MPTPDTSPGGRGGAVGSVAELQGVMGSVGQGFDVGQRAKATS